MARVGGRPPLLCPASRKLPQQYRKLFGGEALFTGDTCAPWHSGLQGLLDLSALSKPFERLFQWTPPVFSASQRDLPQRVARGPHGRHGSCEPSEPMSLCEVVSHGPNLSCREAPQLHPLDVHAAWQRSPQRCEYRAAVPDLPQGCVEGGQPRGGCRRRASSVLACCSRRSQCCAEERKLGLVQVLQRMPDASSSPGRPFWQRVPARAGHPLRARSPLRTELLLRHEDML
mmetsp:Transcript_92098/g.256584  ORF Transcript_92098/g.256584 Transcript_92098/m.256584 type:complete len:230 (-) Transcript_92098:554-1243(-)